MRSSQAQGPGSKIWRHYTLVFPGKPITGILGRRRADSRNYVISSTVKDGLSGNDVRVLPPVTVILT